MKRLALTLLLTVSLMTVASADDLYTANCGSGAVSHIVTNGSKVKDIAVGGCPFELVMTGDRKWLYVGQRFGNGVAVIEIATDAFKPGIGGILTPIGLAIGDNDTRLYVANNTVAPPHVTVVDIAAKLDGSRNNAVIGSIDMSPFGANSAWTVAANGAFLAVGTESGHVVLYDTSSGTPALLANRFSGYVIKQVVFAPGGTKLYAIRYDGMVEILQISTLQLLGYMQDASASPPFDFQAPMVLNSGTVVGGKYLYVTGTNGVLFVFDALTNTLIGATVVATSLQGIAATTTKVYMTEPAESSVQIIVLSKRGPSSDRVDGIIPLPGASPYGVIAVGRR